VRSMFCAQVGPVRFGAKAFDTDNQLIRVDIYPKEDGRETAY